MRKLDERIDAAQCVDDGFSMANAFSYWQGQQTSNASHSYLDDLYQAFGHIQNRAGTTDIEIWNGETGWPTDGKGIPLPRGGVTATDGDKVARITNLQLQGPETRRYSTRTASALLSAGASTSSILKHSTSLARQMRLEPMDSRRVRLTGVHSLPIASQSFP